jgi:hypothetical protein
MSEPGLKDALKFVADEREQGIGLQELPTGTCTKKRYFDKKGRTVLDVTVEAPSLAVDVLEVESLVTAVKRWGVTGGIVAFVNDAEVAVLLDDSEPTVRSNSASLPLKQTENARMLVGLQLGKGYDQKQLVEALRFGFEPKTVADLDAVLLAVRSVKWDSTDSLSQNVAPASEGFGRNVEHKVSGVAAIPESFDVSVMAFDLEVSPLDTVKVYLETLPSERKFRLRTAVGDVEALYRNARKAIVGMIQRELPGVPVMIGNAPEA